MLQESSSTNAVIPTGIFILIIHAFSQQYRYGAIVYNLHCMCAFWTDMPTFIYVFFLSLFLRLISGILPHWDLASDTKLIVSRTAFTYKACTVHQCCTIQQWIQSEIHIEIYRAILSIHAKGSVKYNTMQSKQNSTILIYNIYLHFIDMQQILYIMKTWCKVYFRKGQKYVCKMLTRIMATIGPINAKITPFSLGNQHLNVYFI